LVAFISIQSIMRFSHFKQLGALSRRIYWAFLLAAVIPTAVAGTIGVFASLETLKQETLRNLEQEVTVRAQGIGRFFDQLSSELLYLANSRSLADLLAAAQGDDPWLAQQTTSRLERDYAVLASLYPHVYQIRLLTPAGREWIRVDRKPEGVHVVAGKDLQDKGDRYYFREAMAIGLGEIYVSPLDLNVEYGQIEKPERPVIRVATPVGNAQDGNQGVLIINLHADILLGQIQQMADSREGTAYLLDTAGHYVRRSSGGDAAAFVMEPVSRLDDLLSRGLSESLSNGTPSPRIDDGWIVAQAPIEFANRDQAAPSKAKWSIALAFPERSLFLSAINLYVLYAVLFVALLVTAISGFGLSRRLLRPLEDLARESEAIAQGDFSRRVSVVGDDEIAALGGKFNTMAERLEASSRKIREHQDRLEDEVRARTVELEHERKALEAVIENTAEGILAIDRAGRIGLLNTAARRLLGTRADPVGTAIGDCWPQWSDIAQDAALAPLRCELALSNKVLSLAVTPTATGHIVVARDISRERELQDERRELDRQMFHMEKLTTLGELAMGLAHEIGNPLAGMKAVAQAMQYEEDIPQGVLQALRRLEAEVDRLSGFLRSFHGFAAPQGIVPEPCDFGSTLDDVLFWTRKDAKTQGVTFELCGVEALPPISADPNQLKQVLLNLAMNAVHAMPSGGVITIDAQVADGRARIAIRDTGVGMPADVLARIFEPFFTTRREGTGLGLAIVRKIIEQHGGSIAVESTPGHGSCFTLLWPLASTQHG
jgi:signal transduction histidine kinase